jgi:hypothetical protein
MAEAEVHYRYSGGGSVRFILRSTAEHPDALDMLATRVMRMYREEVPVVEDAPVEDES